MKKFNAYFLLLIMSLFVTMSACDDDEATTDLDRPDLEAPTANLNVMYSEAGTFNVAIQAPGRIASVTATASAGTVEVTNAAALVGQTSGTANITFTAPATPQNATITVTVTDQQSTPKTEAVSFTVAVTEEPAAEVVEIFATPEGVGTTTWTKDNIYVIRGFVFVNEGQTLTIEPGTVIKGQAGQGTSASALIVARGGKIMAEGTAEEPIIFTALADDLSTTTDIPYNARGLWGGVILLGNAPINAPNGVTNIEGIPTSETRGQYGGNNPDDNSGVMKYVSIRHGGTNIGAGNEINGLTMGGVGRGTSISYIEVYANDDDGFEWFGGTANSSYLASVINQDDAFDWDQGWTGENQFWLVYQQPGFQLSDRGFESDGAHKDNLASEQFSRPQIYNMTMIGQGGTGTNNTMFFTEGSGALVHNSIIMNFPAGINVTDVGATGKNSRDRLAAGDLAFRNNIFWNIGTGDSKNTFAGIANAYAPLATHLEASGNMIQDPTIVVSENALNPVPAAGTLPLSMERSEYPGSINGFDYEAVEYIGAFGDTNWMRGWTAADAYGLLD
ncbi:hypothetical protein [Cesiribacter sp. SM1]|uniref:hypothetical protein n=1 Tax=Cesiribacter sp. SM1 TaxID=2861196 RepID=UPI001CD63CDF|nr:hypothetical protein [Cesiribacter sp. SM1]